MEPLQTASATGSPLSTPQLSSKRRKRFTPENQEEKNEDENKNFECITIKSEEINDSSDNLNKQVLPESTISHSQSPFSTLSSLPATPEESPKTERKRCLSKEIHNSVQTEDTNNLKCLASKIDKISVTLENHNEQLKNIGRNLEELCSLKKQELEETKRHNLALERLAMEKIKLKLEFLELKSQLSSIRKENQLKEQNDHKC